LEQQAGITGPAPGRYGGTRPHSERESHAVVRFIRHIRPKRLYAFHSQGEEIFYEYGTHTPPESLQIAQKLALCSGYTLVQNDGLYAHGGLKDWFIDTFGLPGFTIEIGRGENPLPADDLPAIEQKLLPALCRMLVL
jgi:g-D-glutamyl-meso-diaminopimelate peptidase